MKKLLLLSVFSISLLKAQVPQLGPIQNQVPVCSTPGNPITFSVTATNNPGSYNWMVNPAGGVVISSPSTSVTTISFPYTGVNYTVSCTAVNSSGFSAPVTKVIQIYETPTVTFIGVNKMCQGSPTYIMASPTMVSASFGIVPAWVPLNSGVMNPGSLNTGFNPTVTTTYTLFMNTAWCSNSAVITISVNPNPTVIPTSNYSVICSGNSAVLTINGDSDPYFVNGIQTPSVSAITPQATSTYTIKATNMYGCSTTALFTQSVAPCLGIKTSSGPNNMVVYPNPNLGNFTIKGARNETVSIVNEMGQVMRVLHLETDRDTSVNGLQPGVYYMVSSEARVKLVVYR